MSEGLYKRRETESGNESDGFSDLDTQDKADEIFLIEETTKEDGVYEDYEEVLQVVGFGLSQLLLLFGIGLVLASDSIEVLGIGYIIQYLRLPSEFGIASWQAGLLSANIFLGMLIGGYIWGGLADITGRRMTLIVSLFVNSVFAFVSAFSPNFYFLLVLRFISGVGVGGSLPVAIPYLSEFANSRYRGSYLGAVGASWILGAIFCGGLAWAILPHQDIGLQIGSVSIHSWRIFLFMCGFPSFIGAIICIFIPESPRYLLEVRKERRALKILKNMFRLNHLRQKNNFPIKSIRLRNTSVHYESDLTWKSIVSSLPRNIFEIPFRTAKLYRKDLVRSTILMMIVFYCLSFASYGVTLWFPSYIDQLSRNTQATPTSEACNASLEDVTLHSSDSAFLCSCPLTDYSNVTMNLSSVDKWWAWHGLMNDSTIINGHYEWVWLEGVVWNDVVLRNVSFGKLVILNSSLEQVELINVTIQEKFICNVQLKSVHFIDHETNLFNQSCQNSSHFLNALPSCVNGEVPVDYNKEYLHDLIITSSGLLGNVVSAVAVYFFIRSFWLAFSLGVSTLSVFLLYIVHTELGAVIILCVFKAITIPAWNTTSLLVADLYPTSLRSTSSGMFLLLARIGAIMGTYIFGLFSSTSNVTIPILLTAAVLSVGSITSLFLPWTTRKTALK